MHPGALGAVGPRAAVEELPQAGEQLAEGVGDRDGIDGPEADRQQEGVFQGDLPVGAERKAARLGGLSPALSNFCTLASQRANNLREGGAKKRHGGRKGLRSHSLRVLRFTQPLWPMARGA